MVAPYNYLMGGGGPIEAALGGLRIGASLAEMEEARAARVAKEQAALEAAKQERLLNEERAQLISGPLTRENMFRLAQIGASKEQREMAQSSVNQMTQEQQRASASRYGQLVSAAIVGNQPVFNEILNNSIQAETNPASRQALQTIQKLASNMGPDAGQKLAKVALAEMLNAGGEYRAAGEQLIKIHGLEFGAAEGQPPEKVQIVQWLEKATPAQRKLFNQVFPANVADLSPQQQLEWYKNLPEGDRALYDQMRGAGRAPLVTNVLPGQTTPPTEFEKALDNKASQVYTNWALEGGSSNAAARIAQLDKVVKDLEKSATGTGPTLTGVQIQVIPEALRPLLVPRSVEARQNAERIIQEGLRPILGAQFTQNEGENFLKRAFDTNLGADTNARRLRLILEQMKASAKQAQAVADYFEKNGSMRGFKGVYPSLAQFEAVLAKNTPQAAAAQQQTGAVATPVPSGSVAAPVTTTPQNVLGVTRLQPLALPAGSAPPPARQRSVEDLLREYGGQR